MKTLNLTSEQIIIIQNSLLERKIKIRAMRDVSDIIKTQMIIELENLEKSIYSQAR